MIRQCAWCSRILGPSPPLQGSEITHSICPKCSKEMLAAVNSEDKAHRNTMVRQQRKTQGLGAGVAIR